MDSHSLPVSPIGKDWHKADIKAALEKCGWTIRRLAAFHGLNHRSLTQAFEQRYPASERRIADALGLHPMAIWPSRYDADGNSNSRRARPDLIRGAKPSTRGRGRRVKKQRPH